MNEFTLSKRTAQIVESQWGTIEAVADAVRAIEKRERRGARVAIKFARGIGDKTYVEIACYLLLHKHCSWEDMRFDRDYLDLSFRLEMNETLANHGWPGPFRPGRKATRAIDPVEKRKQVLETRIESYREKIAEAEAEINNLVRHGRA